MPDPALILAGLIVVGLAADLVSFLLFCRSGVVTTFRLARSKLQKTRIIQTPDKIRSYVLSGAVIPGAELVVGSKHQWDGDQLKRNAIDQGFLAYPAGTMLRVVRVDKHKIEIINSDP